MLGLAATLLFFLTRPAPPTPSPITHTVTRTITIRHDSTIYAPVVVYKTTKPQSIPVVYLADTNYDKLLTQYNNLVSLFLSLNMDSTRYKIDSFGYVEVVDTLSKNRIQGRSFSYHLVQHNLVTTTVIEKPVPVVRKVFVGGTVTIGPSLVHTVSPGIIYQDRKDNIFLFKINFSLTGQPKTYDVGVFKKIHL